MTTAMTSWYASFGDASASSPPCVDSSQLDDRPPSSVSTHCPTFLHYCTGSRPNVNLHEREQKMHVITQFYSYNLHKHVRTVRHKKHDKLLIIAVFTTATISTTFVRLIIKCVVSFVNNNQNIA